MELIKFVIYTSIYIGLVATSFFVLSFFSNAKKSKSLYTDNELPTVSVLIPAYNEEESIAPTRDAILAVDYPKDKLEIIFIDDGSKDGTLRVAQRYIKKGIKVFHKENDPIGKKGSAMNFALKKAKGEIVVSMDADTFVDPKSLKQMVRFFKNQEVMCVSPGITIHNPRNLLQRIQYMEYLMGLFLRKAFATVNAIHITPGAFSAYRKSFFDRYGGYDAGNITEDLELAMRIQYNGYKIENSPDSPAYTIAPNKFSHLLKQRRRWYIGLMKNMWKYKNLFGKKYGDMGMFVLPIAWISIFFAVFITSYFFIKTLFDIGDEISFLKSIHFDFGNFFDINYYFWDRLFFSVLSNTIIIFILFFVVIILAYLFYASRKLGKVNSLWINLPLFFIFFAVLFGFWWIVSLFYMIANGGRVSWK